MADDVACPVIRVPAFTEKQVRELTWQDCGIARDGHGLSAALGTLRGLQWNVATTPTLQEIELRNLCEVAALIARCALWREESRGAHFRTDYPEKREAFRKDSSVDAGPPD